MSPAENAASPERSAAASWRPLVVLLLVALIAALVYLHRQVGVPDARRYQEWMASGMDHGRSAPALTKLPPALQGVIDRNRPDPARTAHASTDFVEYMSRKVSQAHLRLDSVTPVEHAATPNSIRVQAKLRLTGSYGALLSLMDGLAASPELITVDYLQARNDKEHNRGLVIELWVSRYWVNPEVAS